MGEYGKQVEKQTNKYMNDLDSITKELNDIQNAIHGVEVRGALAAGVKKAFDKSVTSLSKSIEAIDITQNLLDESFDASVIESNFEERLDAEIKNLQPEWTHFKEQTTQQLADEVQRSEETKEEFKRDLARKVNKGNVSVNDINKNSGKLDESYMSDDFLSQITGKTPVSATVANLSLTSNKLADKSISTQKTDFVKHSTNLFDKSKLIEDARINEDTGDVQHNTVQFMVSDFIPATPETVYTMEKSRRLGFYDENKDFISSDVLGESFTTPKETLNIRLQIRNEDVRNAQLNIGDELLPYEEYERYLDDEINLIPKDFSLKTSMFEEKSVTPEKTSFMIKSSNLFDKNSATKGGNLAENGVDFVENEYYVHSDYIRVTEGESYSFSSGTSLFYYDDDQTFIERIVLYEDDSTIEIPIGVHFIRLNINIRPSSTSINNIQINKGNRLLPYEEFGYHLDKDIKIKREALEESNKEYAEKRKYVISGNLSGYYNQEKELPKREIVPYTDIYRFYDDLLEDFPDYVTKDEIGRSVNGLPIYSYTFTPPKVKSPIDEIPTMLLITGTHGMEKMSVEVLKHTMAGIAKDWKENEILETFRWNVKLLVVPLLNVDGYEAHERKNANGVDINRQFPEGWVQGNPEDSTYGGSNPLTEPEAIALNDLIESQDNLFYICDIHNFSPRKNEEDRHELTWIVAKDDFTINTANSFIRKVSYKWKGKHNFLPQDDTTVFGHTSRSSGGTISTYGDSLGLISNTYECSQSIVGYKEEDGNYGPLAVTMFTEAFVNWLALIVRSNIM